MAEPVETPPAVEPAAIPLLETRDLSRRFGGLTAIDRLSLEVRQGEILSLIGPNGAGKTTVFNVISGIYAPSSGQVMFKGELVAGETRPSPWDKVKHRKASSRRGSSSAPSRTACSGAVSAAP